jgi:hypothetical protein
MRSFSLRNVFLPLAALAVAVLGFTGAALADPVGTATAIAVAPGNPVADGTLATFTATVTATTTNHDYVTGQAVAGSTVKFQQYQVLGLPAPTTTVGGTFADLDTDVTDASGNAAFDWDSTGYGGQTIGFRFLTLPQLSGHVPGQSTSAAVDLGISPLASCTGVGIGATLAIGDGNPAPGPNSWTFRIEVQNCDLATRTFKVQGGTNGWAPLTGAVASDGSYIVKNNKNNQVLTWTVELSPGETQHIDVTVTGTIKPNALDGTIMFLSGPWSAAYTDDLGFPAKTDYTGRVSITVSNP